jgi:hypothetical protein
MCFKEPKIPKGIRINNGISGPYRRNQQRLQVGRPSGFKFEGFPGRRMAETEVGGVQGLAGSEAFQGRRTGPVARHASATPSGVNRIAHHRVADVSEMNSDLVSATGMQLEAHQVHQ